jgi:mannose-6-phosphate isomerase
MNPIAFIPIYQERVWGGREFSSRLGRTLPGSQPIGEAWEVVDREEAQSVVADGPLRGKTLHELWTSHRTEVFGSRHAQAGPRFPLLCKLLDARDRLSVQVHPPSNIAPQLGGEPKTEVWYFLACDPGSRIYAGLTAGTTRASFEERLARGTVEDCLHVLPTHEGDSIFIPSGRLHAIGEGNLIVEIQQNSDTTYRVFDWNRVGLDGKPRTLHVQESLQSIDFTDFEPQVQQIQADGTLVKCDYFDVRLCDKAGAVGEAGECVTLAVVSGEISVGGITLKAGDFALLPASMTAASRTVTAVGAASQWLEIRVPA